MVELTSKQERFKSLDTNGDGRLGGKERADAIIDKVGKSDCKPAQDYVETYQFAHGTKAEPTKQELTNFLDGMSDPEMAKTGGMLTASMTELLLRSDQELRNIFPKGVEDSTPEDLSRTGDAISAKVGGCAKAAATELRR